MTDWSQKTCLVTGGAGFIGSHLADKLLSLKTSVVVIDNFDPYYDPQQKEKNIETALANKNYRLYRGDIEDKKLIDEIFSEHQFDHVFHLAAKAGVRSSLENPIDYYQTNVIGTLKLLEKIKNNPNTHFILGSSSSVYGQNQTPFVETQATDLQISPYASSKKSAEVLSNTYSHLYKIPTTICRFFTVYGPRCRPDMAPYKFIDAVIHDKKITKFGSGDTSRSYTYVDDIVDGLIATAKTRPLFEIINLGSSEPTTLNQFIDLIENKLSKKAKIELHPIPNGDVKQTLASTDKAKKLLGWQPKIDITTGLKKTIDWMKDK